MEDIINGFCGSGNNVVLHIPTPTRGVSRETRKEYKRKRAEIKHNGRLKILRYALIKETKNPLSRALRYFLQNIKQYFLGIKEKNVDLIFAASTPPTQGAMCAMVKKKLCKKHKKYIPFVYNLQDIFPDSLVNAGMTKHGSLIYKIGRKIENFTYKNADKIIVIGESFKKNLIEKGVPEDKIAVVSNWIDTEEIKPISRVNNKLFDEYDIPRNKFIILYAGNFGASQGTDVILDAARILRDETDIQFVLFGGGSEFESAKASVLENRLTNITINPLLPPERISEVYSMGDVALITCKRGVGAAAMPSKTWSIMACNTPIVAAFDTDSDLADVLRKSNAGICIEPENAELLAKAITEAKNGNYSYAGGREYVKLNADKTACLQKYIKILRDFGDQN